MSQTLERRKGYPHHGEMHWPPVLNDTKPSDTTGEGVVVNRLLMQHAETWRGVSIPPAESGLNISKSLNFKDSTNSDQKTHLFKHPASHGDR